MKKIKVLFISVGMMFFSCANAYDSGIGAVASNIGYGATLNWDTPLPFIGIRGIALFSGKFDFKVNDSRNLKVDYRSKVSAFALLDILPLDFLPYGDILKISAGVGYQDDSADLYVDGLRYGKLTWNSQAAYYFGAGLNFSIADVGIGVDAAIIYKGEVKIDQYATTSLPNGTLNKFKDVKYVPYFAVWLSYEF